MTILFPPLKRMVILNNFKCNILNIVISIKLISIYRDSSYPKPHHWRNAVPSSTNTSHYSYLQLCLLKRSQQDSLLLQKTDLGSKGIPVSSILKI